MPGQPMGIKPKDSDLSCHVRIYIIYVRGEKAMLRKPGQGKV